uniref:Mce/MlaD domain-containing protein n=1 Tax=Scinaia undulata TaxID=1884664 RepID=A0A1G4NXG8_9FLOR|nr:Hypothetical protein ycf22 [Scinaia undulata]SCW23347.1 Hypothetical protein ycf22 [Scinaia undulata]
MKTRLFKFELDWKKIIYLFIVLFFTLASWQFIAKKSVSATYSVFIEFDNASGIKKGTPLRFRGLNIGSVVDVMIGVNSVLTLVLIDSVTNIIPVNSLVETNQTGLLNDAVIDIVPLEIIESVNRSMLNPLSEDCEDTHILCHLSYLEGDRGLNYDDLIRATTRISQRFDDPRFFNLFYIFLQNSIELTDNLASIFTDFSNFSTFFFADFTK